MAIEWSYAGRLLGPIYGPCLGEYILDENWERILNNHEEALRVRQQALLKEVKKCFSHDIEQFKRSIKKMNSSIQDKLLLLSKRMAVLEKWEKEKAKGIKNDAQ